MSIKSRRPLGGEKEIKGWLRIKKLNLIKTTNPDFNFLEDSFLQ